MNSITKGIPYLQSSIICRVQSEHIIAQQNKTSADSGSLYVSKSKRFVYSKFSGGDPGQLVCWQQKRALGTVPVERLLV